MKKILSLIFAVLFLTGCQKTVSIGSLSLGDSKVEIEKIIKNSHAKIESEWDNTTRLNSEDLLLLGIEWDRIDCKFDNGKLVAVSMLKKLSHTSESEIQCVKSKLRDLCGDGYSRHLTASYGTNSNNNGCLGGINVDIEKDLFFAMIHLPVYGPND